MRGREEGTSVRFVFRRLFHPLCRLVIQTSFLVLKVVNQATGNQPHCVLNFKKVFLYSSFIFVFYKRINPLRPKIKELASITCSSFSAVDFDSTDHIPAAVGFLLLLLKCCLNLFVSKSLNR